MNIFRVGALAFLFLLSFGCAHAMEAVNGTTALLEFGQLPENASLRYEGKKIPLLAHPSDQTKKIALVPVNYRSTPGEKTLLLASSEGSRTFLLHVKKGDYASEVLTVAPSKVTPDKKQSERISKEYHEAAKIYNRYTNERYWNAPFVLPMGSAVTSGFGTARVFNQTLKSFHSGTDFKAGVGTPVTAVNDGVVVIAQERYYAGNSVVIDHGEGLYSCYYHLSRMDVKIGERIKQNARIGLSGMSGRVTGPHLHFAFMLHGVQVDPLQLVDTLNALFAGKSAGWELAKK